MFNFIDHPTRILCKQTHNEATEINSFRFHNKKVLLYTVLDPTLSLPKRNSLEATCPVKNHEKSLNFHLVRNVRETFSVYED